MSEKRIAFPSDRPEQEVRQRTSSRLHVPTAGSSNTATGDRQPADYEAPESHSNYWWSLKDVTSPEWQLLLVSTALKVLLFPA